MLQTSFRPRLRHQLAFLLLSALGFLLLFAGLRAALLGYNAELIGQTPWSSFAEAFFNGLRFDSRVVVFICTPLILALLSPAASAARGWQRAWLTALASLTLLLGLIELTFYREFHQRLNSLVFQYLGEDPRTVLSMLWYGFPVGRYLLLWALATVLLYVGFAWLDRRCRPASAAPNKPALQRVAMHGLAFILVLLVAVLLARGTLRQGPPLRWGDAFTTDSVFANHLGLNGTLTLIDAARNRWSPTRRNIWKATLPTEQAQQTLREMLLTKHDRLVDADTAAIRRISTPDPAAASPIRNVVVILMESFAGHYVGALGGQGEITPEFDKLTQEGLLFTRFLSNGTHTHQGMFATMACFPNLPGFEYLMQQPEGSHHFSGLPQLLSERGFDDLYVYNGDFAWDNQSGFFSQQGMHNFIGRNDYVDPVFSDPTWGVSDQDMFDRAATELAAKDPSKPFYALLQTLSNHTPYALPENLPVAPVTEFGSLNEHLTAMRYSDWALGQFFAKARQSPYFNDTLFVIVGDHGFASDQQLSDIDLYRFHVPMLMIAPGLRERFGERRDIAATQIDIVPTIMGRLGLPVEHQCWGRDLLGLAQDDHGFGVIKPSGGDQTVALVANDTLLVQPRDQAAKLYRYKLGADAGVTAIDDASLGKRLSRRLQAFLQVATRSLMANTAGARP
nr:LTA synthase family protein [uncultured Pseudomonas sp.]